MDRVGSRLGWPGVGPREGVCRVMRIRGSYATISTSMPIAHTLADTSTESPGEESPARLISVPHLGPRPNPSPTPISRISEGNRHFQPGTRRKNRKHTACSLTSPGEGREENVCTVFPPESCAVWEVDRAGCRAGASARLYGAGCQVGRSGWSGSSAELCGYWPLAPLFPQARR